MKKTVSYISVLVLVLTLCACGKNTSDNTIKTESSVTTSTQEEVQKDDITEVEEAQTAESIEDKSQNLDTAEEISGSNEKTEKQAPHYEEESYTLLMSFFTSLTPDITHDEIIAFCDDNGLSYRREDYTSGSYELKIANDSEAALIKYCRNPGENVFFSFNEDDSLSYAEYESWNKPSKKILYYCNGSVFGWKDYSEPNSWYYLHSEGKTRKTIMCVNPEEAIDGAFFDN